MSDNGEIQVDSKAIERLKRSIIIKENMNLKTRTMNDSQMVAWIKKKIEEEVQCYYVCTGIFLVPLWRN